MTHPHAASPEAVSGRSRTLCIFSYSRKSLQRCRSSFPYWSSAYPPWIQRASGVSSRGFWRNHYRGALKAPRTPLRYLIMGSDAISALYDSLTSQFKSIAVLRFFHSLRATFQNASFASIASSFRGLCRNDNVNWGQVVFLTTCVIAMSGCGLLSSLVKRRRSGSNTSRAERPAVRKRSNKSSKSLSSSEEDYEDEDYDSNASLRHGTNPNYKKKEWPSDTQQQSSDGK